jgi:short-subunit dehydrogenase
MNVVITGASKGIGRAIAEKYASTGADLFLCARNMDAATGWQQDLMNRYNVSICAANADLSNKKAVGDFAEKIISAFNGVDILVNNAGLFEPGSVHNEADGILERMIEVNLYSAYQLTRALVPVMIKKKSGHIFNICSIAALHAYHDGGSYSISKWALLGFSKNLREEMKPYGIKVTAVHPGATMTDSWARAGIDPKRIMEAKDIAEMIYTASCLSPQACVEEIIMRPQLGDL